MERINRREFLDRSKKGAVALAASTPLFAGSTVARAAQDAPNGRPTVMCVYYPHWQKMTASSPLVNLPVVTTGWDVTPRCAKDVPWPFPVAPTSGRHEYPYVPVVVGNTPERFGQLLRDAARHVERDSHRPFAVLINAWNEWTEGGYLLPEERTGTGRLEAIQRTFGKVQPSWGRRSVLP